MGALQRRVRLRVEALEVMGPLLLEGKQQLKGYMPRACKLHRRELRRILLQSGLVVDPADGVLLQKLVELFVQYRPCRGGRGGVGDRVDDILPREAHPLLVVYYDP